MAQRDHLTPEQQEQKRELTNARQRGANRALSREKEYVQQGIGTRDWTPEDQERIIDGKVPEGYERHHMKSVSQYPEFADNPDNIQFLNEKEHIEGAHGGDYHNQTNGYYNSETGKMENFRKNELRPVQPKELASPIIKREETLGEGSETLKDDIKKSSHEDGETGKKTEGFASDVKGANADRSPQQTNQADAFAQDVKNSNRSRAVAQSFGEISCENKSVAQTVAHGR